MGVTSYIHEERFLTHGQIAKNHSERLSAATTNGISWCSHSIYTSYNRKFWPITAISVMFCHPWWIAFGYLARCGKPSSSALVYIWSHFQWFAPLLTPRNWPQISHLCTQRYYTPVKVSPVGALSPQADPRNSDGETVCRSESWPCYELSLSESPPKRSIFLQFVISEWYSPPPGVPRWALMIDT